YHLNTFIMNATPTKIYTLSLHDALPISVDRPARDRHLARAPRAVDELDAPHAGDRGRGDRHGPDLPRAAALGRRSPARHPERPRSEEHTSESSHDQISYAGFCLKKKIYI